MSLILDGTNGVTFNNSTTQAVAALPLTGGTLTGTTTFTGGVANSYGFGVGTAVPSSGAGISFPATQSASSDANTLDDYEEGTWTGTLTGGTTAPNTPVNATGKYTKVGNQVTIWIRFANKDTTGASGEMRVTGVPFAASGESQIGCIWQYNLPVPNLWNNALIADAGTTIYFYSMANNAAATTANISAGATRYLALTMTYFV